MLARVADALDRRREYGALVLRVFAGAVLVYGTQDNVFGRARMLEFAEFLAARGVPAPLAAAHLSAYAQFACGLLILLGLFTRAAAAVMVVNFACALLIAHVGQPFMANVPPLAMLAVALFLVVHGPGRPALDARRAARRRPPNTPA